MKKVLVLTAGFGEGHNAAARNIREALESISDDVKVEVLDLFEESSGTFSAAVKSAYQGVVRRAPKLLGGISSFLDSSSILENRTAGFGKLKNSLSDILHETQPDCVVSTYPVYGHVIEELYKDYSERPFRFVTVVTDCLDVKSNWFRAPSDVFCVPDEATAALLKKAGIEDAKIKPLGFPVSPQFAEPRETPLAGPGPGEPKKILYIIHTGKKKAGKALDRLLELDDTHVTITVGRDSELKAELIERTQRHAGRVNVLGWTNQMPELIMSSHLVIGKAGAASVHEAIAAGCPMIVNQVIPGQEEDNARLISENGLGAVAERNREVPDLVEEAFAHKSRLWQQWRDNVRKFSKPDAALRTAELILAECECAAPTQRKIRLFESPEDGKPVLAGPAVAAPTRMLLCDFHIHSNYSDGKLSAPEVVDFYGRLGFDCICITDHLADPRRLIGKLARLSNFTVGENQLEEYFDVIEQERRRAWRKYKMLVMTGIEFNKDGYTQKSSAHLLGVDLKTPINAALDLPETIAEIHAQGGLAIASHPHIMKSEWGKNTLYLWENQDKFAPLIDAWEIANRLNIFDCVGMKQLPFLANSDFHKPKHIYSWKTLLYCEKEPQAIKDCIRKNEHVSITLYRDTNQFVAEGDARDVAARNQRVISLQASSPLKAARGM